MPLLSFLLARGIFVDVHLVGELLVSSLVQHVGQGPYFVFEIHATALRLFDLTF
jgi:hypothetical protein